MGNIALIFLASFLVFTGFFASLAILPVYVLEIGGNEFHSGLQTTLFFLTAVLLRFFFGPYADKKGRKIPLIIGAVAFGTAPLLFLLATNYWMLALARMYQAIGLAAYFSSGSSLVADLAPEGKTGVYIGSYRLINTLAFLIGPAIALKIIYSQGFAGWFNISFIAGLVAIALVLFIKPPVLAEQEDAQQEKKSMARIAEVLKNKSLRPILLAISLIALCYGSLITFVVIYLSRIPEISDPGLYFIIFGVAGVISNLAGGYLSDRFGRPVIVWPLVMSIGLGTLALYFLPSWPVVMVVSSFLAGLGFAGGLSVSIAWLVDTVGSRNRATTLAVQESTIDLSIAVGSFAFGIASGVVGLALAFAITGTIAVITALRFRMALRATAYQRAN